MKVTATLDGESVTVVEVDVNGNDIYITYVDPSSNLKVKKKFYGLGQDSVTIATAATAA